MDLKKRPYSGYAWIKVKKHEFDPQKTWEENYKALEQHHIEETTFLIKEVRALAMHVDWGLDNSWMYEKEEKEGLQLNWKSVTFAR